MSPAVALMAERLDSERRRSVHVDGPTPPLDVVDALAAAAAMGIRSVWCRGLWVYEPAVRTWRSSLGPDA